MGERASTVFLAIVLAAMPFVRGKAQEPDAAGKARPAQASGPAKTEGGPEMLSEPAARDLGRALKDLRGSLTSRDRADKASVKAEVDKTPLPRRPARSVTPPTLTPDELDRLLDRELARTDPKDQAGALDQ